MISYIINIVPEANIQMSLEFWSCFKVKNEKFKFKEDHICDRVCIKGPLVGRYESDISAVKVYWSILVGFREILQSGSLLHKEAVDSHFKLISKLEISRNLYFSEQMKGSTCRTLTWRF